VTRPRALVLRALGLGDFLTAVPALRGLRRALPAHELILAAPVQLRPLVELSATVDRLLDTSGLAEPPWTGPAPEVAVNLHGRGPQSHRLLQRLGPGRLVAFARPEVGVDGPPWVADEHEVARWVRLVEDSFDVRADRDDLRIDVPPQAPLVADAVVVHVGAASRSRRWPEERFAVVARWAAEQGHRVALTGSPDEADIAVRVQRIAGLGVDTVLAGRTDLTELAALVAAARLVVSGDTGVAHLASAYATPSVLLFGPTPPRRWGPPAAGPHTVIWHGQEVGDPGADDVDPALLAVQPEEVVAGAAVRVRAGRQAPVRPAPRTTPASA
jgi:ADP-heptose:LPS heptosyltransferase